MDEKLVAFLKDIRAHAQGAKVLLFGSRATGKANRDSDYDLIVVSESFKKTPFVDRPAGIWLKSDVGIAADLLCFTPKEFARASKTSVILRDGLKHAIAL